MVTETVWPLFPVAGATERICAPGFTVRTALLVLAKAVLVVVAPLMESANVLGGATEMEAGILNVTRLVVPATVVTAEDGVVMAAPPADGAMETLIAGGRNAPVGRPD